MERILERTGSWCAQRPWRVLGGWLIIAVLALGGALLMGRGPSGSYSAPGAQFQTVGEQVEAQIPEAGGGNSRVLVTTDDGTAFSDAQRAQLERLTERLGELEQVSGAADPFAMGQQIVEGYRDLNEGWQEVEAQLNDYQEQTGLNREELLAEVQSGTLDEQHTSGQRFTSADVREAVEALDTLRMGERFVRLLEDANTVTADSSAGLLTLQLNDQALNMSADERAEIISTVEEHLPAGVSAEFGLELVQDFTDLLGVTEILGLLFAALVLALMLRSVLAAGLPLMVAGLGVGVGVTLAYGLTLVLDMTSTDLMLALMLGLAMGVDYMLLWLYRYRGLRRNGGLEVHQAIAVTSGTAGRTVFFAAVTNMVALLALGLTGLPFMATMGAVSALTIGTLTLAVLTVTPAAVGLVGGRIARPRPLPTHDPAVPEQQPRTPRISFVVRHPVVCLVATTLLLVIIALPAAGLRLTLPTGAEEAESSTAYQHFDGMREHFGAGENGRILVLVELDEQLNENQQFIEVMDMARVYAQDRRISQAMPLGASEDGRWRLIHLVPSVGPEDPEAAQLAEDLISGRETLAADRGLDSLGYTGRVVADVELSDLLLRVLPLYLGAVVLVCLAVVTTIFRSLWIPLLTVAGYLLSLAATVGVVVAVVQWGYGASLLGIAEPGVTVAFLPVLLSGLLFGLAIDYQLFITSGMQDARREGIPGWAVVNEGLRRSRPVVLACGLIMVSVFVGFVSAELSPVRQMSFAFAVGVALEAFVVRSVMVPAALQLLGERAWRFRRPQSVGGSLGHNGAVRS
ncbi:MMPL family transporter [Nesterenkonia ebinurensis]|uniref:MMPL family transporter n=1 Tax=Nesterenkonia ebinurensis TaxID=2608252 RepID=UPI00123D73A0|nr:MMPL family transporter [Nesterenkonia ebinurensis]